MQRLTRSTRRRLGGVAVAAFLAVLFPANASAITDGRCSIYADNHLLGSNHHYLSWQVDAFCGSGVNYMKVTYSVLRDGSVWYGNSRDQGNNNDMHFAQTPRCTSGTHKYQATARLNYYYFSQPKSLGPVNSITITCTG